MDKEFLETLGITPEAVEAVLQAHNEAMEAAQKTHEEAMAGLRFEQELERAVEAAGGRNQKAVAALLDLEALRNGEDMTQAIAQLKKENPYLFRDRAVQPYAPFTGGGSAEQKEPETLAGALRERFGI